MFNDCFAGDLTECARIQRAPGTGSLWLSPNGFVRLPTQNFPDEARNAYDLAAIKKWLGVFLFRFFEISQFKRSAVPNSPKVISGGALSPRGDWRAPSDGTARVWLDELEANVP